MITVVLADDHNIVRQGIRALLDGETDITIIGEAVNGLEAVEIVGQLQPDILVLDLMMGGVNGLEVTRRIRGYSEKTGIVILSMYGDKSYVVEALRCGAKAYVLKDSTADELVNAIRNVAAGRRYLSSTLSKEAINAYMKKTQATMASHVETSTNDLTNREWEVLHLVAHDHTNAEIATWLGITEHTVKIHRGSMMRKLGLRSHTQLIRYAIEHEIITMDKPSAAI